MTLKHRLLLVTAVAISSPSFADDCDFLMAQFSQQPVAVISPEPAADNSQDTINARQQALALFAEGVELCNSGQAIQGASKIQQAINLLQGL